MGILEISNRCRYSTRRKKLCILLFPHYLGPLDHLECVKRTLNAKILKKSEKSSMLIFSLKTMWLHSESRVGSNGNIKIVGIFQFLNPINLPSLNLIRSELWKPWLVWRIHWHPILRLDNWKNKVYMWIMVLSWSWSKYLQQFVENTSVSLHYTSQLWVLFLIKSSASYQTSNALVKIIGMLETSLILVNIFDCNFSENFILHPSKLKMAIWDLFCMWKGWKNMKIAQQ